MKALTRFKLDGETVKNILTDAKNGNRVKVAGLGTFVVKERKGRMGVNPRTGERIEIKPGRALKFSASKSVKQFIND